MRKDAYLHRRVGGRQSPMRLAHHIVWEEAYGPIPDGCQIHHIDNDKQNNDLENLIVLSASEHQRTHSPYWGLLNGKWVRICADCREIDKPSRQSVCNDCRAKRERVRRRNNKDINQI